MLQKHSSFGSGVRFKLNRLDLPVVSGCNVGYNYCDEKATATEGIGAATTAEAIEHIRSAAKSDPRLRAVRVFGRDPLNSKLTFATLRIVQKEFPHFTRCVETDGLLLPKKLALLQELGVDAVSINVNAVDPEVGSQIYSYDVFLKRQNPTWKSF